MTFRTLVRSLPLCLASAFAAARADVQVNWISPSSGIRVQDGVTNAPSTWMAQLIYAGADDTIAPPSPGNAFTPSGDDVVLHTQMLNANSIAGRLIGSSTPLRFTGNDMVGHRVYTRVFNVEYGGAPNSGNPATAPTRYGNSGLSAPLPLSTIDPGTVLSHSPTVVVSSAVSTGPAAPGTITVSGGSGGNPVRVGVNAAAGTQYFLEMRASLVSGTWAEVSGPHTGTGMLQVPLPADPPSPSYFRIRAQ